MSKGELTRERIVATAARVFNERGFAGASMADLMEATGLQKGGIYRHFESKEALALEAFEHAISLMAERFTAALQGKNHAVDRLHAMVSVFEGIQDNPPVPGGCPMMNAMIEGDDAYSPLRDRARNAIDGLTGFLQRITARGIDRGEIRADVDPEALATLIVATLEGALAMARFYGRRDPMRYAVEHLRRHLDGSVRA